MKTNTFTVKLNGKRYTRGQLEAVGNEWKPIVVEQEEEKETEKEETLKVLPEDNLVETATQLKKLNEDAIVKEYSNVATVKETKPKPTPKKKAKKTTTKVTEETL